jgi:hypothetical protein
VGLKLSIKGKLHIHNGRRANQLIWVAIEHKISVVVFALTALKKLSVTSRRHSEEMLKFNSRKGIIRTSISSFDHDGVGVQIVGKALGIRFQEYDLV